MNKNLIEKIAPQLTELMIKKMETLTGEWRKPWIADLAHGLLVECAGVRGLVEICA